MPGIKPARYKVNVPIRRKMSWRHKRYMEFTEVKQAQHLILGGKGWYWHVTVMGADLVVRGALCTWFGTSADKQDNGETASGVNTLKTPDVMGCALPMNGFGLAATNGSPLPKIPWFTKVRIVTPEGTFIEVPVIDLGPGHFTNHAIDVTPAAFKKLGGDLAKGLLSVDYKILGGAAYL